MKHTKKAPARPASKRTVKRVSRVELRRRRHMAAIATLGGKARAKKLSPGRRVKIAKMGGMASAKAYAKRLRKVRKVRGKSQVRPLRKAA